MVQQHPLKGDQQHKQLIMKHPRLQIKLGGLQEHLLLIEDILDEEVEQEGT